MCHFHLINFAFIVFLISSVESWDDSLKTTGSGNSSIKKLVYGGTKTNIYNAPYMALYFEVKKGFLCGATIVHRRFLLSAAHCYNPNSKYYVKVGTDRIDGGYRYKVDKIIIHPNYHPVTMDNDISVIKLKSEMTFNNYIGAIRMALSDIMLKSGAIMTTMGFGGTENNISSDKLLRVDVPYVAHHECKSLMGNILTRTMICAGGVRGEDTCQGDSGGPLIYEDMIVGVVSFGRGCGKKTIYGVYASVPALRGFIDQTIRYFSKYQQNIHNDYRPL
ncbi:trypsin alpha-3-like [Nymphalis io]|uniref:trypsin alpha-3-like n=1 Tax=Inachis io TaxID=171585 RepID=UPI002169FF1D|nr:trypsin alpha-3-like [Nymphalis io]